MIRPISAFFMLTTLLKPDGLQAQQPHVRAKIEQLLAPGSAEDTASIDPSPGNDRIAGILERAFLSLTVAEGKEIRDSIPSVLTAFYEVTVRRPTWPYAWLGLGLAKLKLEELDAPEIRSPHQSAGTGWLAGALSAFEQALRREPGFGRAISGVAEVLLRSPRDATATRAAAILRAHARGHAIDASAALSLARVSFANDSIEEATRLVADYLVAGGDSGLAHWELANIDMAKGDLASGAAHYYAAASRGAEAVALVRVNLSLIATPDELARFDGSPSTDRLAWLHRFWAERERADGRPAGSRLREHFRRVRYAFRHFRSLGRITQYMFEQVFRDAPRDLDDRGVIYVRHGEPDDRATFVGQPLDLPNESWIYFRPAGNLEFHFAADRYSSGVRLLETLRPIVQDQSRLAQLYESRGSFDPRYLRLATLYEFSQMRQRMRVADPDMVTPEMLERERQRSRAMIAVGTTTDSDPLDLERTWAPITQVFGVPSATPGQAGLLVVIALPAPEDLTPVPLPGGGAGYVVRLRTTAADDAGRTTLDADSIVRLRTPHPLAKGEFLTLVRSYTLPAGTHRVRVIVADSAGEHGAVRVLNGVPAVDLSLPDLAMSDLVVGREGSGVTWTRPNGTSIPLQPLNAWRTTDAMAINFEVSGLSAGQPYKVRIGIADLGADTTQPPKAAVEFANQASGARELVTQSLGLRSLRPGRYLLTATVTVGDRVLRRERRVTVTGTP